MMTIDTSTCIEEGPIAHRQENNIWNCKEKTSKGQVVRQFKTSRNTVSILAWNEKVCTQIFP